MKKYPELPLLVYEIVRKIPFGRVTTYSAIAETVGHRKASRLIGYLMNLSHSEKIPVPAHRVVNRNGVLTGKHHFENEDKMQELLEAEGVIVENNQIVDFEKYFWHPSERSE